MESSSDKFQKLLLGKGHKKWVENKIENRKSTYKNRYDWLTTMNYWH